MKKTVSLLVLHMLRVGMGCRSVGGWCVGGVCVHEVWWCLLVDGTVLAGGMMWCVCPEGWVVCVCMHEVGRCVAVCGTVCLNSGGNDVMCVCCRVGGVCVHGLDGVCAKGVCEREGVWCLCLCQSSVRGVSAKEM